MKRYYQLASAILLLAGVAACSQKVAPASTVQPTLTEMHHPLTTRTGIQAIDRILDASGDVHTLRSFIQFNSVRCTKLEGLGGPPKCRQDEAEGTLVDVLPFLGPEGNFLRKEELENWQGVESAGLFAIYEVSPDAFSDENYPAGQQAILFVGKGTEPAISLRINNGRIVRVDYVFDNSSRSLAALLEREAANLILAPAAR